MGSSNTPPKLIGGLTHNQRRRIFRLQRQMQEAHINFYMRINDTGSQSWRSRTISAKKMAECAREIYRTVART